MFVFPMTTAPASFSLVTTAASFSGASGVVEVLDADRDTV
jgi:hypothetical protein